MKSSGRFDFKTDKQSAAHCDDVVQALRKLFSISEEEALGRVNRHWRGQKIVGNEDMIYHESPEDLARFIYYEPGAPWWKGEEGLNPRPFP